MIKSLIGEQTVDQIKLNEDEIQDRNFIKIICLLSNYIGVLWFIKIVQVKDEVILY